MLAANARKVVVYSVTRTYVRTWLARTTSLSMKARHLMVSSDSTNGEWAEYYRAKADEFRQIAEGVSRSASVILLELVSEYLKQAEAAERTPRRSCLGRRRWPTLTALDGSCLILLFRRANLGAIP
jgi:hypothetical protein